MTLYPTICLTLAILSYLDSYELAFLVTGTLSAEHVLTVLFGEWV